MRHYLRVTDTDAVRDEAVSIAKECDCELVIIAQPGTPSFHYIFIGTENAVYAALSNCALDQEDLKDGTASIGEVL